MLLVFDSRKENVIMLILSNVKFPNRFHLKNLISRLKCHTTVFIYLFYNESNPESTICREDYFLAYLLKAIMVIVLSPGLLYF